MHVGSARYTVANGGIELNIQQHETLLRYSRVPLGHMGPPGVVHNIAPLYEKMDGDQEEEAAPYEEPIVIVNEVTCKAEVKVNSSLT